MYIILQLTSSTSCLEQLPQLAPHFTACFLTAAAELYGGVGNYLEKGIVNNSYRFFFNQMETEVLISHLQFTCSTQSSTGFLLTLDCV